jgi:hypothetical protein
VDEGGRDVRLRGEVEVLDAFRAGEVGLLDQAGLAADLAVLVVVSPAAAAACLRASIATMSDETDPASSVTGIPCAAGVSRSGRDVRSHVAANLGRRA